METIQWAVARAVNVPFKFLVGNYSLAASFWGFWLVGTILFLIAAGIVAGLLVVFAGAAPVGACGSQGFVFAYQAFATIGTWRSASRLSSHRASIWPPLTKALLIFVWMGLIASAAGFVGKPACH